MFDRSRFTNNVCLLALAVWADSSANILLGQHQLRLLIAGDL
jgi:hypothetical protein